MAVGNFDNIEVNTVPVNVYITVSSVTQFSDVMNIKLISVIIISVKLGSCAFCSRVC